MSTQPPGDNWPTREGDRAVAESDETVVGGPPAAPPPDRRIGQGMLLALLFLALIAGGILAWWLLTRDDDNATTTTVTTAARTSKRVAVPRLIGLKEQQALVRLGQVGLRPKERFQPTKQPTNVVVSQRPDEATEVKRGSQVTIVIDSGAPKVTVPDVRSLKAAEAVQKLDALGLDSTQTQVTSTKPTGTVVDQAPQPGQKAAKGSTVTLSVAKAAPVAVPNVVGQQQAQATTTLQNAGFEVNPAQVPSAEPSGTVVAQSPSAGEKAVKGSSVRINVSTGQGGGTTTGATTTTAATTTSRATTTTRTTTTPRTGTVPNLVGSDLQSAATQLGSAGLLASVQYIPGTEPLETVLQQSPTAGRTVPARTHVTLNVSSGPGNKPQKTVPNVVGQTLDQAVSTIKAAGLRVIFVKLPVTTRTQAGKVVEQTPKAGSTAPQNAQVLIYLGAFRG